MNGPRDRAVCFVATDGYLLQSVVGAHQAKSALSSSAEVIVVHVGRSRSDEFHAFERLGPALDVRIEHRDSALLGDLHPAYSRLFLDLFLPEIKEFLYLDGDTQIRGDLSPLLEAPTNGQALAARDPMVIIRETSARFRRKVDVWWAESAIRPETQRDYINSGMLRLSSETLRELRIRCFEVLAEHGGDYRFLDQDLINLAAGERVEPVSVRWNFPGFFLGTQLESAVDPVVIHFMSDPRPWQAPYRPWGEQYFAPYQRLVERFPETAAYWHRAGRGEHVRYSLQQFAKVLVERPLWQSRAAIDALELWDCAPFRSDGKKG